MRPIIIAIFILVSALPVCAQTVGSCAAVTDDAERLKCYDSAAKPKLQKPQKTDDKILPFKDRLPGGWKVFTFTDRLDATKKTITARSSALPFAQGNGFVSTIVEVSCYKPDPLFKEQPRLTAWLNFSSTVAVGERMVRWRVDQKKLHYHKTQFYSDGKAFALDVSDGETIADLRKGNTLKVEADLPWAGNVLLEFDISGAADAFAKLECSEKAPRPPVKPRAIKPIE
jgi:hypothetical protein